ncbi:hypothetical protein SAMN05443248_7770 [Bradyrhizobium erythrophlei]|uniref:Uncharacterized protein n=1 Tax=Bradyrhizobium erythrophlei TaxID=1437360 RepID=A0A1M5XZL5_9BRAD|nr:hypothetical protein SAMN05443248_7770 [Bradyrhizobium erythrophlei]
MIRRILISIGLWIALTVTALADGQYCIVKIGDLGKNLLIGRNFHRIPGLAPIFTPTGTGARYTISSDRRLIPYGEPYPTSYLDQNPDPRSSFAFNDHWRVEPWSGRIVASAWAPHVVAVLKPGAHSFQTIGEPNYSYSPPFVLPRSHETVISRDGKAWVVGIGSLEPWKPADGLMKAGADGIDSVYDAPSIPAVIVIDTAHRLWGSLDNVKWQKLASLDKDAFGRVFDSPGANSALFVSLKSVTRISKADEGGKSVLLAETLSSTNANGADRDFAYLPQFGEVLQYARGTLGEVLRHPGLSLLRQSWRKLTTRGFEPISGADDAGAAPQGAAGWRVTALKSLNVALIDGSGGLFTYDGKQVVSIKNGERTKIGKYPTYYDLPAIERTLVKTPLGLKVLSGQELVDVPIEFPSPVIMVSDWPEADRAVIFSADKVSIIDRELKVSETLDSKGIDFDSSVSGGTNPETGDLIFTGKRGTYLIVDEKRNGSDACIPNGN